MSDVFAQLAAKGGDNAEVSEKLKEFTEKKLYHQLVEAAVPLFRSLNDSSLSLALFNQVVKPFSTNLNPVNFMEVLALVLPHSAGSVDKQLAFLEENFEPFDLDKNKEQQEKDEKNKGKK